MRELCFHRNVYAGEAVDEAAKLFGPYAALELTEAPTHWIVKITADSPNREREVAGELGNYALGITVRKRGAL